MDLQLALQWFEIPSTSGLDLLLLKKKYRKLTLKYHPDKGGKTADFVKLQAAYNFLQECIKYPYYQKSSQTNSTSHNNNSQKSEHKYSEESKDIEFYKQQIEDLKRSNISYQNLINSQIQLIKQFYNNLDQINIQSKNYDSNLSKLLDIELAKLDKKYKSGWWKGIVGFKTMDKNDLVYYQNQLIGEYNNLLYKSQKDFSEAEHKLYQKVTQEIVKCINMA